MSISTSWIRGSSPPKGVPDVEDAPNGLSWDQLTRAVTAAVACGGCLGWSLAIYDPDQDPNRSDARRILRFVEEVAAALPAAIRITHS